MIYRCLIGEDLRAQAFIAAVAAAIPMGIVQSSSTQNDYVVAFWLVCGIYHIQQKNHEVLDPLSSFANEANNSSILSLYPVPRLAHNKPDSGKGSEKGGRREENQ